MRFFLTLSLAILYIQASKLPDTLPESDGKSDIMESDTQQVMTKQDPIRSTRNVVSTAMNLIPQVGAFFGKVLRPLLGGLAACTNSEYNE